MAVFDLEGNCYRCGLKRDAHERDVTWEEWDCPKEKEMREPTKQERWTAIVETALGRQGRMLSGSKSSYLSSHPKSIVYFNGNIYDEDGAKLWFGDVDLTKDAMTLAQIAHLLDEPIYVTAESPFRWEEQTKESLEEACAAAAYSRAKRFDP